MDGNERMSRTAFVQEQRERAARDLEESRERLNARLAAGPPLDTRGGKRQDEDAASIREAKREDVRQRVAERVERRAVAHAAELAALERRWALRTDELESKIGVLRFALDGLVAGALDRLAEKLTKVDIELQTSRADLLSRIVHVLEMLQPQQHQTAGIAPVTDRRAIN